MNVLILSCGSRNKIVQYFRNELRGRGQVIAADSSQFAPALYDADRYFIIPRVEDPSYLERILRICRVYSVDAVFSLIDPELSILAKHRQAFLDIGTTPIISDYDVVEMCFDKYATYEFLVKNGFKGIRSYVDKDTFYWDMARGKIRYPVFVKPVRGSGSAHISKAENREELEFLFNQREDMMIQEYMEATEYGADVYIDLITGEVTSIFVKEKIKMRAGETDKSVSYKDERLFDLITRFVKKAGLRGIIDIDIFKRNEEYYISEVNPRFGGGYLHGYECGVNIPAMIVRNLDGIGNEVRIGDYDAGVYMMKYNEVKIIEEPVITVYLGGYQIKVEEGA